MKIKKRKIKFSPTFATLTHIIYDISSEMV